MKQIVMEDWSQNKWLDESYSEGKRLSYKGIESFFEKDYVPRTVLDIGCGMAFEAQMLQEKYGCDLYLLDGDYATTPTKRAIGFGPVDSMAFYTPVDDLKKRWDSQGMDYTFVDANNISIPDDVVFDLVISNVSCGYHYPLDTYYDLLKKHTNEDSLLLFDIRNKTRVRQLTNKFQITDHFRYNKKAGKYKLKLLDSDTQ